MLQDLGIGDLACDVDLPSLRGIGDLACDAPFYSSQAVRALSYGVALISTGSTAINTWILIADAGAVEPADLESGQLEERGALRGRLLTCRQREAPTSGQMGYATGGGGCLVGGQPDWYLRRRQFGCCGQR